MAPGGLDWLNRGSTGTGGRPVDHDLARGAPIGSRGLMPLRSARRPQVGSRGGDVNKVFKFNRNHAIILVFRRLGGDGEPKMTDDPAPPSEAAGVRAQRRARRETRIARRERCFNLMTSGYSLSQIAKMVQASAATVRREIDQALAERRLDAPERFAQVQIARLMKALRLRRGRDRAWRDEGDRDLFAGRRRAGPLS